MLGLFALNSVGISGGVLQMINHGLSTGALFCIVGMFYERYHTRQLSELGGLANRLPLLAVAMTFTTFASIGLPGLNGFVGEVMSLMGMFSQSQSELAPILAILAALGVVLSAWYLLGVLQKAFFGPLQEPHQHGHEPVEDLNFREIAALAPLLVMFLWLGLFPQPLLELIRPDIESVAQLYGETHSRKTPVASPSVGLRISSPAVVELVAATLTEPHLTLQERAATQVQESEVRK
jgi:NADH-quinone oxidoreductase subunit M